MADAPWKAAYDVIAEAERVRQLRARTSGPVPEVSQRSADLIGHWILGYVLLALSDAGFYEYIAASPIFDPSLAATSLDVSRPIFDVLMEYLTGVGLLRPEASSLQITDKGADYFNLYTRGLVHLYVGGYSPVVTRLSPLMRKEMSIDASVLDRAGRHVAQGTAYISYPTLNPGIFEVLEKKKIDSVLDLGCGTGDFLVQFLLAKPDGHGVGVDMNAAALGKAREYALARGVVDRLRFHRAQVGVDELPAELTEGVGAITANFMLHEFGRNGPEAIVTVLKDLRRLFPGKLLLASEAVVANATELGKQPTPYLGGLNYLFVHPLTRQGRPLTPEAWEAIFKAAGTSEFEIERANLAGAGKGVMLLLARL
jgi:SAM-dependent methyltransferase